MDYFLIPPIYSFHIAFNHDFVQWGILIVNGALISLLSESLHRSRRQAEMSRLQHEKSEERFLRAMEATSDGLWDWDVAGGSVYYSPGYFRMLGYEPDGFPAKTDAWLEMVHPDDRKRALAANEACIRNDVPTFGVEFRMLSHDGTWRWILRRGKAVTQDADGRALRMSWHAYRHHRPQTCGDGAASERGQVSALFFNQPRFDQSQSCSRRYVSGY